MYGWQDAGLPTVKASDAILRNAAGLYAQHCTTCHQQDGSGVAGVVPALKGSPYFLDASGRSTAMVLLKGANTHRFQTQMPGFWRLSDLELQALTNHVRAQFAPPGAGRAPVAGTLIPSVRAELGATLPQVAVPGAQGR